MAHDFSTENVINALFKSRALEVAPPEQPFWYTSGTLGPYYINTHYLMGGPEEAGRLLAEIDSLADDRPALIARVTEQTIQQTKHDQIFSFVIDLLVEKCAKIPFDLISGGERRDFFFSLPVATRLKKQHLALFKDQAAWLSCGQNATTVAKDSLKGLTVLHISDLVTQASSYFRAWLPAIKDSGARILNTLTVVDRGQSGAGLLRQKGVALTQLLTIDRSLFKTMLTLSLITDSQFKQIANFLTDPLAFQDDFLQRNPDFIEQEIKKGGKNRLRALQYLENERRGKDR